MGETGNLAMEQGGAQLQPDDLTTLAEMTKQYITVAKQITVQGLSKYSETFRDGMPKNEATGSPPTSQSDKVLMVRSMMNKHKGEHRMIQGRWRWFDGPMPRATVWAIQQYDLPPAAIGDLNKRTTAASGADFRPEESHPNVSRCKGSFLAPDDKDPDNYHWRRQVTTVSLPQLFSQEHHSHSCKQLYEWYLSLPVIVQPRRQDRAGGSDRNRARQQEFVEMKKKAISWLDQLGLAPPETKEEETIIARSLGEVPRCNQFLDGQSRLGQEPPHCGGP